MVGSTRIDKAHKKYSTLVSTPCFISTCRGAVIVFLCSLCFYGSALKAESQLDYSMMERPPAEYRTLPFSAKIPGCQDIRVIERITGDFYAGAQDAGLTNLLIKGVYAIKKVGWRNWGQEFVPRRFCKAEVILSDHRRKTMHYTIYQTAATLFRNWDVSYCVENLFRYKTYEEVSACATAKP